MNVRRPLTVVAGVVASIALAAGPASAHFCFHKDLNAKAAAGMAGSNGYFTLETLVTQFIGLCDEGAEMVYQAVAVSPDTLINAHGAMAGGLSMQGRPGNKAIGHLDFAAAEAVLPDAFAACGMEMPEDF